LIVEKRAIGVVYNTNNIETCSTADSTSLKLYISKQPL
jgi:hypothetical protein